MGDVKYFFDTYALIEIYNGNKNYLKYKTTKIVTSYFHIYEFFYNLIKEKDEKDFLDFFNFLKNFCVNLDFNWISKASKFKLDYSERNLSYADCIGYVIAKELGIKFLTGDKEFEDLSNVEFVKK